MSTFEQNRPTDRVAPNPSAIESVSAQSYTTSTGAPWSQAAIAAQVERNAQGYVQAGQLNPNYNNATTNLYTEQAIPTPASQGTPPFSTLAGGDNVVGTAAPSAAPTYSTTEFYGSQKLDNNPSLPTDQNYVNDLWQYQPQLAMQFYGSGMIGITRNGWTNAQGQTEGASPTLSQFDQEVQAQQKQEAQSYYPNQAEQPVTGSGSSSTSGSTPSSTGSTTGGNSVG